MEISIDLEDIGSICDLIGCFNGIYELRTEDVINLKIKIPEHVYPQYLTIIVGIVKYLRSKNVIVEVSINNLFNNNYVKRINFYRELEVDCDESFCRKDSRGRFLEITRFDNENNIDITNEIMDIIRGQYDVDDSVMRCLNYCFFEMIDNVQNHAYSPIDGYTVVQNYKNEQILRICILDSGIGIHKSLTHRESKYTDLTQEKALEYCIKEEVTSGNGMGNGLFHTNQFILENKGKLNIYSGDYYLNVDNGKVDICECPYWQGSLIYIEINKNNNVDLKSIFGDNIPTTVLEMDECLDDLW